MPFLTLHVVFDRRDVRTQRDSRNLRVRNHQQAICKGQYYERGGRRGQIFHKDGLTIERNGRFYVCKFQVANRLPKRRRNKRKNVLHRKDERFDVAEAVQNYKLRVSLARSFFV